MTTPDQKPPRTPLRINWIDVLYILVCVIVIGAWLIGFDHML